MAVRALLQATADRRQRLPEEFVRVAAASRVSLRDGTHARLMGFGQRQDLVADAQPAGGFGKHPLIELDGNVAAAYQGLGGHGGCHAGIAVAIASDPAVKADFGCRKRCVVEQLSRGLVEAVENLRHRFEDGVAEKLKAPFDLVVQTGTFQAKLSGQPEQVDFRLDILQQVGPLGRGPALGFETDETTVDPAMDLQNRNALGFRRVGRQGGTDAKGSRGLA